jgi:hypothetical protein
MISIALDYFFLVFHTLLILFNLFGWIWKPFRKANLTLLLLTGFSWVGLGLFYGMGYCPLTDWHWDVLYQLNQVPQTHSYIAYLFNRLLGVSMSSTFADTITLLGYLIALFLSVVFNLKDWKSIRKNS